jgi:hypothetical protein
VGAGQARQQGGERDVERAEPARRAGDHRAGVQQHVRALGRIIVPPGYTDPVTFAAGGNPYGVTVTASGQGGIPDAVQDAIRHQSRRLVQFAARIAS